MAKKKGKPVDSQNAPRRLILGSGEKYLEPVKKKITARLPPSPRSFAEAAQRATRALASTLEQFDKLPDAKKIDDTIFMCMRLHPETSPGFEPNSVLERVDGLRAVGSRRFRPTKAASKSFDQGSRLVFVRAMPSAVARFMDELATEADSFSMQFQNQLGWVEHFDLLDANERIMGFRDDWQQGRVELVFHPDDSSGSIQIFVKKLMAQVGIDLNRCTIKAYSDGPVFVSAFVDSTSLAGLVDVNPLRAARPLEMRSLSLSGGPAIVDAPQAAQSKTASTIKVGMFDGGVDEKHPLLQGHVAEDHVNGIGTTPDPHGVSHGNAVAGVLLYGPLNDLTKTDRLPDPSVFVSSIRIIPTSNPLDPNFYESIDVIEKAVPARRDISVFNLSFGPRGAMEDDDICRFSYALDKLATQYAVSFYIATGNDASTPGWERIQPPSDSVNCIAVGAYSDASGMATRAAYSCMGPGRSGAIIKPDLVAFGGCGSKQIHLIDSTTGKRRLDQGTSFATPQAARVGALLKDSFDSASCLLTHALTIHHARHPSVAPCQEMGYGVVTTDLADILLCRDGCVLVAYQETIKPGSIVKLPIPAPSMTATTGRIKFKWTIAALSPIDSRFADSPVQNCLVDTFYPHSARFKFTPPPGSIEKAVTFDVIADPAREARLLGFGWKKAGWPETQSVNGPVQMTAGAMKLDLTWNTIVHRSCGKQPRSLQDPFLTLKAKGRRGAVDPFPFAAVVAIEAHGYVGDLYTAVRQQFPALQPIRLRQPQLVRVTA